MSEARDGASVSGVASAADTWFDRQPVCILGLPFDAISLEQAVERIRGDALAGRRCFVSTPNLNFAIAARADAAFRDSVLHSDLSLIDGMPLVWIGRLLGLPIPERVSGADVFEAMQVHAGPPITVYFFGGPSGAAELACQGVNRRGGGLRCVGYDSPGFGSIESISSDAHIARINASGARFVVVALGARKGQAWIEHNAARLEAPVLSHLGAVVNFAAGTVRRAPRSMRWLGMEWLWRIREEPGLWRRYWRDGASAARLLWWHVVPDAIASHTERARGGPLARVELISTSRGITLALYGSWFDCRVPELRLALRQCARRGLRLSIDLHGVVAVGNSFTAVLLLARGWFSTRSGLEIAGADVVVADSFHRKLADQALLQTTPKALSSFKL